MPREMFILEFRMNARHSYTSILDCGKLPVPFDRITMTTSNLCSRFAFMVLQIVQSFGKLAIGFWSCVFAFL